ncbi:MAG: FAD-dependent oxidoreductase [Acetobacteraceae bacterium]
MAVIRTEHTTFDAHVPIVVVGGGACGMTAGLAAADGGAEVVVLERDATPSGTTSMAQGFVCAAGSKAQRAVGVEDAPEAFLADIMAKTRGATDADLARTIAHEAAPTIDWLMERHDLPFSVELAWRGDFGHSRPRLHGLPSRTGAELLGRLTRAAEAAGVMLTTNAHVVDLYADNSGTVLGVGIERPTGARETLGCAALILATSGFGASRAMVRRFIPDMADSPYFGHEGDDGEGISLGMELGAATADMGAFQGYGALAREPGILVNYNIVMEGGVQVNALGRRFSNELEDISGQSQKVLAQPGGVAWVLYDERLHASALRWPEYQQLTGLHATRRAETAEELAGVIGVPADALATTITATQAMAGGKGKDSFGRDFTQHPPLVPPYHAAKVTGALFHTQGGLVVDPNAQVRRADGSLLPNLFAGGGTARSISGPGVWGYLPAVGLCMAVTLGRLAGAQAARIATK